ncbi:hypothetical protein M422DRAFT_228955 [Sphaerobolus stellatus SS14]|uniref:WW domain-containing protein n=1 Tax=Sphaerobolus stellatus (strain SS14) TaxID=990650 RepID=A0A0C9VZG8_SPHS4|nr:hypothetical protein M422DRAFT_228955 [Sphaerobolus stellatus SS14]
MSNDASKSPSAGPAEDKDTPTASTSTPEHEDSPTNEQHQEDRQVAKDSKTPTETDDTEDGNKKDIPDEGATQQAKTEEAKDNSATITTGLPTAAAGDWQAIWSPAHNAYYFHNARTGETTWANPLQPEASNAVASSSTSQIPSAPTATPTAASTTQSLYAAAEAAGIDPSLAYLDPTLAMPGTNSAGAFVAKFNARTGAFTRADARDPTHLSEAERAKRMSQVYFDVNAWEQEVEQRYMEDDATGKKRKRPTKKDLERFKEQKKQKKIAKTAWLRT